MKKVFPYFFLLLYVFNVMGYIVVYQLQLQSLKREVRSNMLTFGNCNNLQKFEYASFQDLCDHGYNVAENEINWKGKDFDIVSIQRTAKGVIVSVYSDTQEEKLMAGFENHVQTHVSEHNTPQKNKTNTALGKDFVKHLPTHNFNLLSHSFEYIQKSTPLDACGNSAKGYSSILSPPPQLIG